MLNVTWIKSTENAWLSLRNVNLSNITAQGVYVIWKPGSPSSVIRVGQGDIKSRLSAHRLDSEITAYGSDLLVTWASVQAWQRDGVERYLADRYQPLVGDAFPDVNPIQVNLVA